MLLDDAIALVDKNVWIIPCEKISCSVFFTCLCVLLVFTSFILHAKKSHCVISFKIHLVSMCVSHNSLTCSLWKTITQCKFFLLFSMHFSGIYFIYSVWKKITLHIFIWCRKQRWVLTFKTKNYFQCHLNKCFSQFLHLFCLKKFHTV